MSLERRPGRDLIRYRNVLLVAGLGYLLAVGLLATRTDLYTSAQTELFLAINGALSLTPAFWLEITAFGNTAVVLPLFSIFIIRKVRVWAALFGSIPAATFMTHAGKRLFGVPRPAAVIDPEQFHIAGPILRGETSFPSGHTITIFTAATVIVSILLYEKATKRPRLWAGLAISAAALVGISRIAVGAHWPLDVLTGAVLGIIAGFSGVYLTYRYKAWWDWARKPRGLFVQAVLVSLFIYVDVGRLDLVSAYWLATAVAGFVLIQLLSALYSRSWRYE
jgi:membrane-associated phospholipid phosphatase